jgi:hypothetical protein
VLVASYPDYAQAEAAVDRLADAAFPVRHVRVVGFGLTTVEQVTGRVTKGRAVSAGSASGAAVGLLMGLLISLFMPGVVWLLVLLASVLLGAFWGGVVGFAAHWSTHGRRDFASRKDLAAERYDVMVRRDNAVEAAGLLGLPNVGSGASA